jgi:hypothetical protein
MRSWQVPENSSKRVKVMPCEPLQSKKIPENSVSFIQIAAKRTGLPDNSSTAELAD